MPDAQTRLLLVRTGAIDVTEVTGFGVDVARTIRNARVVDRTTNVVDYLQYNLHTPALRDVHVRRAIAMAISVSPPKGDRPVSISNAMAPSA